MMDLLSDLRWRGLIHQTTDDEGLATHLAVPRKAYAGFEANRDSLTIGNLVPLLMLARFQRAGHTPVALIGGATGLIGDPSGKEAERLLLSPAEVEANVERQRVIYERLLDFSGSAAAILVNNIDWLGKLSFIDTLRDIGKHFSVNMMIQKDSVRERLKNREQGISYTEFSYMLLQAYDFLHLYEAREITVQLAGSDQWGNIVAGVDLIRRKHQATVYGLTAPLITKADGTKFGKTEAGAVWLSPDRTSPYAFYQFWLNATDADVGRYLKVYTLLSHAEISELLAEQTARPQERPAQLALARHVTELLHGSSGFEHARHTTEALFSGDVSRLDRSTVEETFATAPSVMLPKSRLDGAGLAAVDLLVDARVAKSKREARELLSTRAILVNGRPIALDSQFTADALLHGEVLLIRRGKKTWHVAKFA